MKIGEPCCDADSVLTAGDLQYGLRRLPGTGCQLQRPTPLNSSRQVAPSTPQGLLASFSPNARSRRFVGVFAIKGPRKSVDGRSVNIHGRLRSSTSNSASSTSWSDRSNRPTQVPSRTKHLMIHFDLYRRLTICARLAQTTLRAQAIACF